MFRKLLAKYCVSQMGKEELFNPCSSSKIRFKKFLSMYPVLNSNDLVEVHSYFLQFHMLSHMLHV